MNFESQLKPGSKPLHPDEDSGSTSSETFHDARFPPDEEAALIAESHTQKAAANTLFGSSRYSEAISTYDAALASCPSYLDYEIAVLKSNISACHLKLEEWKQAIDAATAALEALDREDPPPRTETDKEEESSNKSNAMKGKQRQQQQQPRPYPSPSDDTASIADVVELDDSPGASSSSEPEDTAAQLARLELSDARRADISRIRAKSLLRRARARSHPTETSWSTLSGAEEDLKLLISTRSLSDALPPGERREIQKTLMDGELPRRTREARERETAEMMGKLKELGNGILKPFGLSTENFKFVKDETTGGYSMNFQGNGGNG